MADCSRPPHRNQRGLAKNLSSVFGFGNKGAYDDVFVSRPKMRAPAFTPGVKDYAEIFNCSQPSSIPVLELDEFEKSEGFGDKVRSSEVDYGNVFGSLGEGQIGSSYEEVFCVGGDGDGVRRTEDSHAHSRGSDRSTAVEESQKLTHESFGKKRSMSSEKITRGGKDEIYETNGQVKYSEAPVSARGFDGTVPQKKAGVTISGAVSNNFKQYIEETPVGKHSRNVSSGGLSKHDADGFIEIDVRSGNGYASDKSISNDMQMDRKIIKPKAEISDVATSSDSILQLGSPVATPKEQAGLKSGVYNRSNASEVGHGGSNNSSREGIKVQSVHGPVKPFIRDSTVDENVARHNSLTSKMISSSGLTYDQVGGRGTPEILTGNSNARNSNASDNAKDDNSSYSRQEVKFQTVTCLRKPFISNSPVDATDVRPRESSKLTPATHSQHRFGKLNTAYEGDLVPKIIASGNADSESSNMGSNGHLTNSAKFKKEVGLKESISSRMVVDTKAVNFESQNSETIPPSGVHSNLGHVGSALKKALTSKSGESRSTDSSVKDNHSPNSSDDEIDKNSDAAISAAAVKKAIREAQAWINIAKESNGVKGFMTYVAKKSGNVKVVKEVHSSKVKENLKFFDLGQTATENNFSTGAARKDCIASRSLSSEMKIPPADIVGEEVNYKGAEFCASDRLHQMKDAEIQRSLMGKTEVASTIQHVKPSTNISEEKLAVCISKANEKLVHRKEDIAMQSMDVDSGQVSLLPEANCFEVPTVEKTEAEVNSASHEAFLNSYHESNTVTKITKAEKEPQEVMNNRDQGFMMRGFHVDFGQCKKIECSANSFEVKEDVVPGTGDIAVRSNQNEAIKGESESLSIPSSDNSEEDLTFLEKENVKESELDPHDQVSDCEDLDSQDYASAEENWVSTDTDDDTNDKDLNLSAKNQLDEIEDMENMVAPEVTIITEEEDVSPPIVEETEESEDLSFQSISAHEASFTSEERTVPNFKYSNEDPIVEEIDESEDMPLQKMVTHEADVTPEERTSSIFNFSNEDSIVEETDESEDLPLQTMVTHEEKFTSEGRTAPNFNYSKEDPIVEETDESENAPVQHIVTPGSMITSEDGLAPCLNSTNGDPGVETEGIQTAQNVVIPESLITLEEDIAPCFDKSNEDQMVEEITGDITDETRVCSRNYEHEKGAAGVAESFIHEQTSLNIEELECVSRVEAESASRADHESSHSERSEVEIISTDDFTEESKADTIEESRSTPWICEQEKQELGAANYCNLESRTEDREELQNVATVEAEAPEERHDTMKAKGFKNDQVTMDAAGQEDAVKLGSTPLYSENGNHELEAGIQFCEPIPNSSKNEETIEFELPSENLIHPVERHKRKKWEIPRETFELTELEIEASEVEDSIEQDCFELESQMDKHERKKWEIPNETFELPVLGDKVVEENEGNVEQDMERVTQPAEKPERKKWKIQKEVFEVPILCAEAVQETSKQEGFVIKTASEEEIGMGDNLSNNCVLPEEIVQHDEAHGGVVIPYKGVSSELCGDNSKEDMAKEWMPEVKMVDEEEPQKQLNKDFNQQETKVEEEKAVGQDECTKGPEDINVKDEIKRTLGMLWKKIYTGKQDEDSETVESVAKEEDTLEDINGLGLEKDLNLKGPVELVESPRLKDDIEILNYSGQRSRNEENVEEASYSEPFEVNGSSTYNNREFVSTTEVIEEVQTYSPSAFDSCKHEEDEKGSQDEETCKQNYNAHDVESLSEEILSSSEDSTETAPVHGACELKKEGTPERNVSDVSECIRIDSETVCRLEHLLPDDSLVEDAENTQKVNKVLQPNISKNAHDDIVDENISEDEVETHLVDDLFDKSCTDSEQQEMSSSRQDSKSVSDSEVRDVTSSHKFEQNEDKNETGLDTVEQACRWKWIFGEESMDNSNEQGETPDVDLMRKEKPKTKETADEINMSHVTGKTKINGDEPPRMEEREPEGMHKEVIPDQEVLKNMMRAKEIERMAVERAIREARERAFAEARERAATEKANADARERAATERANAEFRERVFMERANADARDRAARERAIADARRKVTANGQERSQKTSSEAKLAAEKNALEAKRKAELERAAVERATMEARQRAMEKAMFRKDQVSQCSSSRSNSASDDQYGSSSKDNDDKPSESALRFKARNERHQRIAERAANALAEKNMRDLLVQREQAERNRLSEVLDAEVKRWARGKTGNLRALLSTLQYILGPDSGWQPIHLTEIVTADSVKKAYRKATLFVHPDKLQQRGAAIKQKYVCEKVFDLLKEAWNRFDRDER